MVRHCSTILCAAVAALVALGLIMLASTSAWVKGAEAPYYFLTRQAMMVGVGLVFALVAAKIPLNIYRKMAPLMFIAICILLVLCFVPGIGISIYGSKRWIGVGGFSFQPSEFARMVVVVCLAAWFARWQSEVKTFFRGFIMPGAIAGIPILLIAAETDVGTALSLSVAVGALMFCVGTRLRFIVPTALTAMAGAFFYLRNNENRWGRIEAWLDLENPIHQLDRGMQQWRALRAT